MASSTPGATANVDATVPGARRCDCPWASSPPDLQDMTLTAWMEAANAVGVLLPTGTTDTVDPMTETPLGQMERAQTEEEAWTGRSKSSAPN